MAADLNYVDRLLSNAAALLKSAQRLFADGNIPHGTHFAIICTEECAKCLMYILRETKPELFATGRYKHLPKYETFLAFHHIMGALSMVHLVQVARNNGFLGGTDEDFGVVLEDLLSFSGAADLDSLARAAKRALEAPPAGSDPNPHFQKIELYRKISVYCDLDNTGQVQDSASIEEEFSRQMLEHAAFGVALLQLVRQGDFSLERLDGFWPSGIRAEMEQNAREMVEHVRAATCKGDGQRS